jgi:hypothetical protein
MRSFTMNFCIDYTSEIEEDRQDRYYNSLKPSMTPEQRKAFERLLAAKNAYIQAHASEVYQGGSIHGIRTIGSEGILEDIFRTEVVHFERRKWPALSQSEIANADAVLGREYEKHMGQLRERTKEEADDGAVTADQLAEVQEKWQQYRDAWVVFARVRYPEAVSEIRAEITLDRYRLVKTID